jgi:hypothetical protein
VVVLGKSCFAECKRLESVYFSWKRGGGVSRHKEGRQRFKKARKGLHVEEEISYLTVSADLPLEAVTLPERKSTRTETGEHIFTTRDGIPIEGPMTLVEMLDEVNRKFSMKANMPMYEECWTRMRMNSKAQLAQPKVEWTPRWEHMLIALQDQVKVTAWFGISYGYSEELILRKGFECEDFHFWWTPA